MKNRNRQFGISLIETIVVVAVVALMIGLAIPAVKTFTNATTSSSAGTESMISAALSSARSIAAKHQKYAGIRFQQDKNGNQYMIAIIYDEDAPNGVAGNLGMVAVKGLNPVKLPEAISVFDLKTNAGVVVNSGASIVSGYSDISTFTILFSPAGNLVVHQYWVKQNPATGGADSVFNIQANVDSGVAIFVEDGVREESRTNFVIYEKKKYDAATDKWNDYIKDLPVLYINPYSGSIISNK